MITLKTVLIVLFVHLHDARAIRTATFPIGMFKISVTINIRKAKHVQSCVFSGGLFNRETLPSSVRAFENMIEQNRMATYHGRSLDSKVVDSYSTSLERK